MMKTKRILSVLLALCLVAGLMPGTVRAVDRTAYTPLAYTKMDTEIAPGLVDSPAVDQAEEEAVYDAEDMVRAFIVLNGKSTMEKGYATAGIASNQAAEQYAESLKRSQETVAQRISAQALDGQALQVRWNLTLAANAISADVRYGDLEAIAQVQGVKAVYLVPQYEVCQTEPGETVAPNTISAGTMVGSYDTWAEGYTGAGSRIAVIDTGLDTDHPSFDPNAFDYSLMVTATKNGKEVSDYGLLTAEEIEKVLPQLNAFENDNTLTGKQLYRSTKLGYGYNYVDGNLNVTHDLDSQGYHGTHVSGIATANRYVPVSTEYGEVFAYAANGVVGIAPDAQILTMKVFGATGGAYADDYIAAIEDAIVLGCDAVNLSLGSASVGFTTSGNEYIDGVMATLTDSDTVVSISAGNSGTWAEESNSPVGLNYITDVSTNRVGSPGSYANSFTVASADNIGSTGPFFQVGENKYMYTDGSGLSFVGGATCRSQAFTTLDTSEQRTGTDYEYVFLGDPTNPDDTAKYGGSAEDFQDVAGKIVLVSRGGSVSFTDKQSRANAAGAAGVIIYNNEPGNTAIYAAFQLPLPAVTISQDAAEAILADTAKEESGRYAGKMMVSGNVTTVIDDAQQIHMSEFSSWGVPGDLTLKPEITAPGGNIYSTADQGGYTVMSGTSMAAPSVTGMAALVAQYIQENQLDVQEQMTVRALAQSLLMGTAIPSMDPAGDMVEYSPRSQGAGLANVAHAVTSPTYITMHANTDGKVKAELGDDPDRTGCYRFTFDVHNMTDAPATYTLDSSVMTPGTETDGTSIFQSLTNQPLGVKAACSGEMPYDLNGDGAVDSADAMAILRHVTGTAALANPAAADLDGNGKVEAVDAQIFAALLAGKTYGEIDLFAGSNLRQITVPAHGVVTLTATIALDEETKARLDETYTNGTYVEGYLYLNGEADAADQSIPFLAFYGNWTDPSMLDRYKYAEDCYDADNHKPYLSYAIENYYSLKMAGSSSTFVLGRNLFATDTEFIADRTAFNGEEGNRLNALVFSLIRNAALFNFQITDAQTEARYVDGTFSNAYGAYYHSNAGVWTSTRNSLSLNWKGVDAEGKYLPNNTKVNLTLTTVPEYNVRDGEIVGRLGKGAVWTMPVTIDNQAPEIQELYFASDALTGEKTINVEAIDNQYIAAVQIHTGDGSRMLTSISPNQQTANTQVKMAIDVADIQEDRVIVLVVDYAGNTTAYYANLGGGSTGESYTGFFAYQATKPAGWINFTKDNTSETANFYEPSYQVSAAAEINGYVFFATMENQLMVCRNGRFSSAQWVADLPSVVQDMTVNPVTGKLYGLTAITDADGSIHYGAIEEINTLTGEVTVLGYPRNGEAGDNFQTLACSDEGVFYAVTASNTESVLYSFTISEDNKIENVTQVGPTGYKASFLQTMTFDSGKLYWAQYYQKSVFSLSEHAFLEINTQTGAATKVGETAGEWTAMYSVGGTKADFDPTDEVINVVMETKSAHLYTGNTIQLSATANPWTLTDRGVNWSSSDTSIAEVNADGIVTALATGTVTITASAKLDATKTTSCVITIDEFGMTLQGVVYDSDNKAYFADIDVDTANFTRLAEASENFISVTRSKDKMLAATETSMYELNPDTYEAKLLGANGLEFQDMTYTPHLDLTLGVYGYYLMIVDAEKNYGYSSGWNLNGAFSALAGIAYAGYDNEYDYFWALSSSGTMYLLGIYKEAGKYTLAILDSIQTNIALDGQYDNQSLYYDYDSGWLYWSMFDGEGVSKIIAVNENTQEVVERGSFGANVWPCVGLFSVKPSADMNRTGDNLAHTPAVSFGQSAPVPTYTAQNLTPDIIGR